MATFEEMSRQKKAQAIYNRVLDDAVRLLGGLTDDEWQNLASQAEQRVPSAETRRMVVDMVRRAKV